MFNVWLVTIFKRGKKRNNTHPTSTWYSFLALQLHVYMFRVLRSAFEPEHRTVWMLVIYAGLHKLPHLISITFWYKIMTLFFLFYTSGNWGLVELNNLTKVSHTNVRAQVKYNWLVAKTMLETPLLVSFVLLQGLKKLSKCWL